MAEKPKVKPKVTSAGSINVSKQFAANKSAARKPATTVYKKPAPSVSGGYSGIPATAARAVIAGGYSGIPATIGKQKPIDTKKGESKKGRDKSIGGTFDVGRFRQGEERSMLGVNAGGDTGGGTDEDTGFPAAGTFAGYEYSADRKQRRARYHDGKGGFYFGAFETNPDYKEDDKKKVSNIAYDTLEKILESYRITGIASVLESIREEYPEASSEDILTLLQFDNRYNAKFNERFAANVKRQKAGKSVYSPGDYLALEQGFQKVFDAYNLPKFKTQLYYDDFIEKDIDTVEVTERVQLAYDRVLSDDPVNRAFKQFYSSLGFSDIVSGMLDPVNQLPALQQKVKAAEIGGAALRQGLTASELATTATLGADVLAKQGITKAEAEQGYSYIAEVLPTAEAISTRFSDQKEDKYGRLEAEQEKFQGLASAERKRKRLSELEEGLYRGSSGMGSAGLSTQYLRKTSSGGQF